MVNDSQPFMEEEIEVRGIPRHHLIEYIQELGGVIDSPDHPEQGVRLQGKDWIVWLKPDQSISFASLTIPQIFVIFSGSTEAVNRIVPLFRRKIMRAGG
ncbi:MAG: hypothetical protein H0Z33_01565 [Bacillaceae bacterium]|nr:hypothetical protein [Bacillaceae bacterium]